jgi:hypothetical protein
MMRRCVHRRSMAYIIVEVVDVTVPEMAAVPHS